MIGNFSYDIRVFIYYFSISLNIFIIFFNKSKILNTKSIITGIKEMLDTQDIQSGEEISWMDMKKKNFKLNISNIFGE